MMQQQQLIIMELYKNAMKNNSKETLSTDIICLSSNSYANTVFKIIIQQITVLGKLGRKVFVKRKLITSAIYCL